MNTRRAQAICLLLLVTGLAVWAISSGSIDEQRTHATSEEESDLGLYRAIIERVKDGEGYYEAAVAEQITRGFATSPPMTVRLPMLSWVLAALGEQGAHFTLAALLAVGLVAFLIVSESGWRRRGGWIGSILLLAIGSSLAFAPGAIYFHETWAFAFILLGISAAARERWVLAVLAGLAAVSFRELAMPFLAAMMLWTLIRRKRSLAIVWAGAIVVFIGAYFVHGQLIQDLAGHNATPAPQWLDFGGWPFIVDLIHQTTPLLVAPYWLAALLVSFALVGWFHLVRIDSRPHQAMFAAWISFAVAFMLVGAPNNIYWGLLFTALVLPGLAATPRGITQLKRDLFGNSNPQHRRHEPGSSPA